MTTATSTKYRGKVLEKPSLRPGKVLWPVFILLGLVILAGSGWLWWQWKQENANAAGFAGSRIGIGVALVSMSFALIAMLYPVRKRTYLLPIGHLEPWCITHVFTGLISFLMILVHADFGLGAWVSAALLFTFGAIFLSGIYGYFVINERNPKILNRLEIGDDNKQNVRLLEDLQDGIEAAEKEIKELEEQLKDVAGVAQAVRKKAESMSPRSVHYKDSYSFASHTDSIKKAIASQLSSVPVDKALALEKLAAAQAKINNLSTQFGLQFQLRAWLSFHIVATALMLTLLFAHVATAVFAFKKF
jgi:hypothetical protein